MGAFSCHQPIYAEHGIATFPLNDNKKPAVRNYQKLGIRASASLAERFRSSDGLGFMTNARSRLTVLDVDTTDDRVLADAMSRHGSTPLVGRTASGKFHALYKHNGEFRKIRPFAGLPIDLLGVGGLAVAVPSRFAKGEYYFIEGCLDDVDRLPVMRSLAPGMYRQRETTTVGARPSIAKGAIEEEVPEGVRNSTLWRYSMRMLAEAPSIKRDAVLAAALLHNRSFAPPLSDAEVVEIVSSACDTTAKRRNYFGGGGKVVSSVDEVDCLMSENLDAFALLMKLRRHNWSGEFIVANAMAETMGWTRKRFAAARTALVAVGKIRLVRQAHTGSAALYAWS